MTSCRTERIDASRPGARGRSDLTLRGLGTAPGGRRGRRRRVRVLGGPARGVRLELDIAREKAYWVGVYEPEAQDALARALVPGAVFYDVGAHIGFFSMLAGALGARVYAFEPMPENAARIRDNAGLNSFDVDVDVIEVAVWDSDAGIGLLPGGSSSEWRATPEASRPASRSMPSPSPTRPPDVIRIDVEGAEREVLAGAARLLAERRPVVIREVHGNEPSERGRQLLAGYVVETLGGEWKLVAGRLRTLPKMAPCSCSRLSSGRRSAPSSGRMPAIRSPWRCWRACGRAPCAGPLSSPR